MPNWKVVVGVVGVLALWSGQAAGAPITIDGILFPQGDISFADEVTSFDPVIQSGDPSAFHLVPTNALGEPDFNSANNPCDDEEPCDYVSLGDGGSIVLRFINNLLTGSGDTDDDLWIFEVGPDVEDTFVEVSSNGSDFFSVGSVGGATSGIDLDAFGFGPSSLFRYVRLTDNAALDDQSGITVGADIDAIGAISTVAATSVVPEPATMWLLGSGLAAAGLRRLRRQRQ